MAVRAGEMTWPEYRDSVADRLCVLPVGGTGAHGPHLPLGTDTIVVTQLADLLCARIPCLVLPAIPYGCRTNPVRTGGQFPGNADIRGATLTALVAEVVAAMYEQGARRFLILNGHYANAPFIFEACADLAPTAPGAQLMTVSWWDMTTERTRDAIARECGVSRADDNHAAIVETSLMMHLAPRSVHADRIVDDSAEQVFRHTVLPLPSSARTKHGVVFRARGATAAIGARVVDEILANLVREIAVNLPPASGDVPGAEIFAGEPEYAQPVLADRYAFPSVLEFDGSARSAAPSGS
ncbi:creatininase family protein [Nocardia asiatica]|uniref:creatininase family protein n=1 Tax=Nocardia asiatica TaxID=209252 RepID=UPI003EE15A9E